MNWEETIISIRQNPAFTSLVRDTYIDENLLDNVRRYQKSAEYREVIDLIEKYRGGQSIRILDVGAGNGITSISFAEKGYNVTALEPDPSETVGYGAIEKLKSELGLENVSILKSYAEDIDTSAEFDVVFVRQALHHANDLKSFVKNTARPLKKGGLYLTVRDHVIFNDRDKLRFLESHPLHKFYGGENAFTLSQYKSAFLGAGLMDLKVLRFFDSVINYYPFDPVAVAERWKQNSLQRMKGVFGNVLGRLIVPFYRVFLVAKGYGPLSEKNVDGRMYTFISRKR